MVMKIWTHIQRITKSVTGPITQKLQFCFKNLMAIKFKPFFQMIENDENGLCLEAKVIF